MSYYGELTRLANKYATDKGDFGHHFTYAYEAFFRPVRESTRRVLEIGIGFGASIRMLADYFHNATIVGVDINRVQLDPHPRIVVEQLSAGNFDALRKLAQGKGPFDIVIDDGGHFMVQQQVALAALLPHVQPRGLYIIEDLHTSLVPGHFGVEADVPTTLDLVNWLSGVGMRPEMPHLDRQALDEIRADVQNALVFDANDGRSLTSILRKRG